MSTNPIFSLLRSTDPYEQLIASVIQFESQPVFDLETKKRQSEAYKEVLGTVDSSLSALHTLVKSFGESLSNPFAARIAQVPEDSPFTISAGDSAAFGSHSIRVDRLASTDQRVAQQYYRDNDELRTFFDTNGSQTFGVLVASPTDDDPLNRVTIDVTVDPVGLTNEEILDEIDAAIETAMSDAVDAGLIRAAEKVSTSVVNETSDVARLTMRAGKTGFANRIALSDSAQGLLAELQISSSNVVAEATPQIIPPSSASVTGTALTFPLSINGSNRNLSLSVDGQNLDITLSNGSYATINDIADELQSQLGGSVVVSTDNDALVLSSAATGTLSSIQITGGNAVTDLGLEVMAIPEYGDDQTLGLLPGGMITDIGTSESDSSLNAKIVVDGLAVYRSTNQITDAVEGVSIDLLETSTTASEFVIDSDTDSIRGSVDEFIEKYNSIITLIKDQTFVDGDLDIRATLAGDTTFTNLRFALRSSVTAQVTGQSIGAPSFLGDLGIDIEADGTLKVADEEKLTSAVKSDAEAVRSFFDGSGGVATRLETLIDTYVGTGGIISFLEEAIEQRIKGFDNRLDTLNERLDRRETQLRREFAQLQEVLQTLGGQQNFLSAIFG